jgi:hypothetical protein
MSAGPDTPAVRTTSSPGEAKDDRRRWDPTADVMATSPNGGPVPVPLATMRDLE